MDLSICVAQENVQVEVERTLLTIHNCNGETCNKEANKEANK